jgi:prepilin-type N-terminal cleavage/methylation domain-containing protein
MKRHQWSAGERAAGLKSGRDAAGAPASAAGFSLIEILIVLAILGIVVAMVAPKIDLTRYRLESEMQGVGMTLLASERQAITQQHDVIVMFDAAQGLIRIHDDKNNNGLADAGERVRGVAIGEGVVFGRASAPARPMGSGPVTFTKIVNGLPAVVFHRDGSASEAGGFYLTSVRAATSGTHVEDTRAIELERATGRASWYRYGPPSWRRAF